LVYASDPSNSELQNKQAYTPEVCHRITWAIIVDTRSFFDNIKLTEDFIEYGDYMQFPAFTLEGDFMSIKHGIKIQRHNFPPEWGTPDPQYGPQVPYHLGKSGRRGYQPLLPPATPPPGTWSQPPPPKPPTVIGHGNEIRYIYEFISYISYYVNSYKGASS